MTKNFAQAIIILFLAAACEDAVDIQTATENPNLIIVEAILTNENINHRIRLTHPYEKQNQNPLPISGAEVTLFEDDDSVLLKEFPVGSGDYYTPKRRALVGKTYKLLINYQGQHYTAQDRAVAVQPLPPINLQKSGDNYKIGENKSGSEPNFVTYVISWENTDACNSENGCGAFIIEYDLKTIDVNEFFKPRTADLEIPPNSVIIRKKYSVSEGYRNYLRSMLSETEWRGGVFDVQRDNVATNLSTGAAGFFAVSTVVSDTIVVR